ncbi:hypothetical protein G3H63_09365 [Microbacterium resistens]|uniref:YqaJ viral recombinase family protein n=1 Tax=Microbacterium resistens TaxID=156977 RepID=UPI001C5639ED|nr:YqaJ viral recombinase family protein [Microbacterium resistens]MBW1639278.1 hypothetical protein [Microbacterium resistens]
MGEAVTCLADLGRTLADTADPASWSQVHSRVIGSYQAGAFAKPASVETYVRQMLSPRDFKGNAATRSGNRWEPFLLAWAGAEPNSLLIHHPDERQYGATVDGTRGAAIVETKAKHNKVVAGPTPREVRQMAWQLYCLPEYEAVDFTWGELVRDRRFPDDHPDAWRLRRDPLTITFPRDHPRMVAATDLIVPIAGEVLAALNSALAERTPF